MCVSPLALGSRRGRGVWVTALQSLVKAKDRDWRVTLEIILESLIFFFFCTRAGGGAFTAAWLGCTSPSPAGRDVLVPQPPSAGEAPPHDPQRGTKGRRGGRAARL